MASISLEAGHGQYVSGCWSEFKIYVYAFEVGYIIIHFTEPLSQAACQVGFSCSRLRVTSGD